MPESREWEAVIGLEIHVQLSTQTKMFCSCRLSFGDDPNTHTCPVCLGHPGALPVTNAQAVRFGIATALALDCELAPRSIFHRKNYFYPDLPKGYQISQYDIPLASAGRLGQIRIHRAHLEEDAAKSVHVGESGRIHGSGATLVDYNRGGTPLIEIVTEPDLRSAAEAREWLLLLRTTLRQIGVSDVNMEEGSLRCDANVSVREAGAEELGVKTELKNMNSFRFLERGIEAELARQTSILESGGEVEQETLHFDPRTGSLTSLRSKEEAHDYRYFPEPDLVPVAVDPVMIEEVREGLPELPAQRAARYSDSLGVPSDVAMTMAGAPEWGDYFEAVLAGHREREGAEADPAGVANWVTGELAAALRRAEHAEAPQSSRVSVDAMAELIAMVDRRELSRSAAKTVLDHLVASGGSAGEIVEREGLGAIGDSGELESMVETAIAENQDAVAEIKAGNGKAIGAIVGAVMRQAKGRADGGEVNRLIREKIGG